MELAEVLAKSDKTQGQIWEDGTLITHLQRLWPHVKKEAPDQLSQLSWFSTNSRFMIFPVIGNQNPGQERPAGRTSGTPPSRMSTSACWDEEFTHQKAEENSHLLHNTRAAIQASFVFYVCFV